MKNRLIIILISLICLVFIVNLSRSISALWQKGTLVSERATVRDQLEVKNQALKRELAEIESPEYVEKQAREKLNLQREGEIVVVLPEDLELASEAKVESQGLSNWQRWWNLFF